MVSAIFSTVLTWLAWPLLQVLRLRKRWLFRRGGVVTLVPGGRPWGADELAEALRWVAQEPGVRALSVDPAGLGGGWARTQALREALVALREAGKHVVMHLEVVDTRALLLSSCADRVWVTPATEAILDGPAARLVFFGDALASLGLRAEVEAAGAYKSYGESYSRAYPSAANREQISSLVGDLHSQLVTTIAAGRGVPEQTVDELLRGAVCSAEELVALGLVDEVAHEDQARDRLATLLGARPRELSLQRFARWTRFERRLRRVGPRPRVVVVHLDGQVTHGPSKGSSVRIEAGPVVRELDRLRKDPTAAAVVLAVDSPGGSAVGSDIIARSVARLSREVPVVAAFGDVSASGGYYLSAHAHQIVAQPGTITGSIGVVAGKLALGAAAGSLGVHAEAVRVGPGSGLADAWEPLSAPQRRQLRALLDRAYDRFIGVVSAGRKMPRRAVERVAQGRVWTGRQALECGLIDALGGVELAVARARLLGGLPQGPVSHVRFRPPRLRALAALLRRRVVSLELLEPQVLSALTLLREAPGQALALLPWTVR